MELSRRTKWWKNCWWCSGWNLSSWTTWNHCWCRNGEWKKDQSVAQVTLYDIDEKRELTIAVKCTVDEYSILSSMISIRHSEKQQKIDAASEIRKFKELLDDGIISAEEFEDKKKQLLDL